jgi:CO/xanthine dehydrogenase FAD-binding subunit
MHPFAVSRADDAAKAIAAHALDPELAFIAGGTDLIGLMKDRTVLPERLLDINGLPNMARIEALPGGGVRIGALARMSDVAADTEVRRRFPVVAEALLFTASGQLRNMASIGGNIMQRTRCAYFRDETDGRCNKRRLGSGCAALHGFNRNHAIFGWSESCVATNPSDLAVALAAMDALVIVRGKAGERQIPLKDFHRLPDGAHNPIIGDGVVACLDLDGAKADVRRPVAQFFGQAGFQIGLLLAVSGRGVGHHPLAMLLAQNLMAVGAAETSGRDFVADVTGSSRRFLHRSLMPARCPASRSNALPCAH